MEIVGQLALWDFVGYPFLHKRHLHHRIHSLRGPGKDRDQAGAESSQQFHKQSPVTGGYGNARGQRSRAQGAKWSLLYRIRRRQRDGFSRNRDNTVNSLSTLLEVGKQGGTDLIGYDSRRYLDSFELRIFELPENGRAGHHWPGEVRKAMTRTRRSGSTSTAKITSGTGPMVSARAEANNAKKIRIPFQG